MKMRSSNRVAGLAFPRGFLAHLIVEIATCVEKHLVNAVAESAHGDRREDAGDYQIGSFPSFLTSNCPFARGRSDRRIALWRSDGARVWRANGEKQKRCKDDAAHGVAPGEITCSRVGHDWERGKKFRKRRNFRA